MSKYAVARLDEIVEQSDGRCPWRPVRRQFGITSFGANAWTGQKAGDRIINEHDEDEPGGSEELYLVLEGHAVFELDGERADAPAGTFVFVPPGMKRTAFAEASGTTILAFGGTPGENKKYHRFHRVKGGFLSVVARGKSISFRHHDVSGKVVYQYDAKAG